MLIFWALAMIAGITAVLQSGVTKKVAPEVSLAFALHMSNLMVLVGGILLLTLISALSKGEVGELLKLKVDIKTWNWWILFPGLMGLFTITVLPIAISRIGALQVFVAMVFGQVFASGLWDWWMEGKAIDKWRIVGCVLTLLGAYSISLSKA